MNWILDWNLGHSNIVGNLLNHLYIIFMPIVFVHVEKFMELYGM